MNMQESLEDRMQSAECKQSMVERLEGLQVQKMCRGEENGEDWWTESIAYYVLG